MAREFHRKQREADPAAWLASNAARQKKRRQVDADRVRAEERALYRRNAAARRARQLSYHHKRQAQDGDAYRADKRRWTETRIRKSREAHQQRGVAHIQRTRARGLDVPGDGVPTKNWLAIVAASLGLCAYCNARPAKLTMDHVEPIARGGWHDTSNVVAACDFCNKSKGTKSLLAWLAWRAA
jgi:5-methylcytosine-specific restriction endonuclease McrA